MGRVLARLTGVLTVMLALLAGLPAPAGAALTRDAQRIYDDYRSDGVIEPCDHTATSYRATLEQVTPDIEEETPAFRPAVEAALEARDAKKCKPEDASEQGGQTAPATGSSSGGANPAPADSGRGDSAPAPAPGAGTASPPATSEPAPAQSGTDAGAPEPASPAPARPVPAAPAAPAAAAAPVLLERPYAGTPTGLLIAAALIGLTLLAVLATLAARRFGWAEERLAPTRHAWGEAAYRTSATWGDFVDWIRLGR